MFLFYLNRFRRLILPYYRFLTPINMRFILLRSVAYLGAIIFLHTAAMMKFEGMSFGDSLWLTLTTMTTVGYGDQVASTILGRASTVLLIYVGGIFLLFQTAANYFEYRVERKFLMIKGYWRWKMRNHVLIMGGPSINKEMFLSRLVGDLRESEEFAGCPIQILTNRFPDGLPDSLRESGLVLRSGYPSDPDIVPETDVDRAKAIILLTSIEDDIQSDAFVTDRIRLIRELGAKGRVLAECVHDKNRQRMKSAGADVIVRPDRFYPEILVRGLTSAGSLEILENLFTSRGDVCIRIEVRTQGKRWADVAHSLMEEAIGLVVGYEKATDGSVECNPPPDIAIDAIALYVICRQDNIPAVSKVNESLQRITNQKP